MKFYSETLDKLFDTEKALVEAETAAKKAAVEKEQKAAAKKAEAKVVEDAFKARNAARAEYNKKVLAVKKVYAEDLKRLREVFDKTIASENEKLNAAEKLYDQVLKEFIAKHPEGYHLTLKEGDNVVTLHSNHSTTNSDTLKERVNDGWFDAFFNLFKI